MRKPIFKGWGTSPQKDWKIMFSIFLLFLVIAVGWSSTMYNFAKENPESDENSGPILSKEAIHRTALFYNEKEAAFERIKGTPEPTPDPSK